MRKLSSDAIGIIVLAAGFSKRFTDDKRQALMPDGETLLDNTLKQIPATFRQRILILHPGDEDFAQAYQANWRICIARDAASGMGHSLASAIPLAKNWDAALIALGDMPYVQSTTYSGLQKALLDHPIVRPSYLGKAGNPVGFQSAYFSELAALAGDQGARKLLGKYANDVYLMDSEASGLLKDVDIKADLPGIEAGKNSTPF